MGAESSSEGKEEGEGLEVTGGQISLFTFSTFTEESLTWRHVLAFVHDGLAHLCEMIITESLVSIHHLTQAHKKEKEYIFPCDESSGSTFLTTLLYTTGKHNIVQDFPLLHIFSNTCYRLSFE